MNSLVLADPTRSLVDIYETVRSNCTEDMDSETKISFLQEFPSFRTVQANLYRKRREIIPADPKAMTDLKVDLKLFQYNDEEVVIKGDQVFSNGRRVVMYTTNDHLEILARAKQVLGDGTFRVTPKLWCQTFIISVSWVHILARNPYLSTSLNPESLSFPALNSPKVVKNAHFITNFPKFR